MNRVNIKATIFQTTPKLITYGFWRTDFGTVILACFGQSASKLCHLKFVNDDGNSRKAAIKDLKLRFPKSDVQVDEAATLSVAENIFKLNGNKSSAEDNKKTVELVLCGTEFQQIVWQKLLENIQWGEQCSYSELAVLVGNPRAARAVARAMASNPICILIPCHRVVAKADDMRKKMQYGGGAHIKRLLLDYEATND